jgi:PAS domain S-box-containing protein
MWPATNRGQGPPSIVGRYQEPRETDGQGVSVIDVAAWAEALGLVGVAVVEVESGGHVVLWNDGAEAIYGWTAEEAIGRPVLGLIIRPEQADAAIGLHQMALSGGTWSGHVLAQRRDDSLVYIRTVITPHHDAENRVISTLGVSVECAPIETGELARTAGLLDGLVDRLASVTQQVRQAIAPTVAGLERLSPREQEVLALLRQGLRVPSVAERLSISPNTVRNQLRSIFRKLDVRSQRELLDRFVPAPDDVT